VFRCPRTEDRDVWINTLSGFVKQQQADIREGALCISDPSSSRSRSPTALPHSPSLSNLYSFAASPLSSPSLSSPSNGSNYLASPTPRESPSNSVREADSIAAAAQQHQQQQEGAEKPQLPRAGSALASLRRGQFSAVPGAAVASPQQLAQLQQEVAQLQEQYRQAQASLEEVSRERDKYREQCSYFQRLCQDNEQALQALEAQLKGVSANLESQVSLLQLSLLKLGTLFIKHQKKGAPKPQLIWLEDGKLKRSSELKREARDKKSKEIAISEIKEVTLGANSESFSAAKAKGGLHSEHCFSIVTSSGSLDLQAPDATLRAVWINALKQLMKKRGIEAGPLLPVESTELCE